MPRTRSVPNEIILEASLALMHRHGPEALTLSAVGSLAELSAATLLQRFGSKDSLRLAALEHAWTTLEQQTATADAEQPETFEGALGVIASLWPAVGEAPDFAGGLLLLREDLRDPQLRSRGAAWLETVAKALGRRLATDPDRAMKLGRLMVCQWQGAQIWWAFSGQGSAADSIAGILRDWHKQLAISSP